MSIKGKSFYYDQYIFYCVLAMFHALIANKSDDYGTLFVVIVYVLIDLCVFVYPIVLLNLVYMLHILQNGNVYVNDFVKDFLYNFINLYSILYHTNLSGLIIKYDQHYTRK